MTSLPTQGTAPTDGLTLLSAAEIDAVAGGLSVGQIVDNINRTVLLVSIGIELTIGLLAAKKC